MRMDELKELTFEELLERFETNMESHSYRHDMAVLCGSLGVSPEKYSSFMRTLDEIETLTKVRDK